MTNPRHPAVDPSGHSRPRPFVHASVSLAAALFGLVALAGLTGTTAFAEASGEIRFVASNLISTANGTFHTWRVVKAEVDPTNLEAGFVEVEVDIASVDTGIERRDEHLKTVDFFEIERWPTARVRVHGANPKGAGEDGTPRYSALFDLRIRDVSKTVEGEFRIVGREPLRIEGSLEIDRMDFGIGEPETWNPMSITQRVPITFAATLP